uniref:Aliphatic sulfonates import ATP-binding protein SsuB n=1 Tax=Pseudomonas aeruginosa TaxID=287 RepID=A0A5E5R7W9_PSEAI|nr:Aliphatic sulfonates import ATP-binding protein SsuB [Pseudomonas aeruginosa]
MPTTPPLAALRSASSAVSRWPCAEWRGASASARCSGHRPAGSGRAVRRYRWPQRLRQEHLLRLLAGLDQPSRGELLAGSAALAEAREDTRLMFQDSRLLPWKRVIDNVGLGLRGDWRAKALQALRAVGLAERANEWPAALSGGQKQRVALARALIHEPRLLLLDEPLGALDALTRIEMQQLIEGLWREHGFTVLLVTHDVSEAVAVADRVILIEDGEIGLDLPVELPRPRSRGSARLAALEAEVLNRVLAQPELPPQPEPVSPLPTQLRWAL